MSSKQYFKHRYGYINIDDDYVYFTGSGNWGEARDLKEKPENTAAGKPKWWVRILFYLYVLVIIGLNILVVYDLITSEFSVGSIAFLVAIFLLIIVEQARRKFGPRFRIPREKIISMTMPNRSVLEVRFMDAEGNVAMQYIKIRRKTFQKVNAMLQARVNNIT